MTTPRKPRSNIHAKHSSHDGRTNHEAGHNNTYHRNLIGGTRPYNQKPHTRTTSRGDNPARHWTDMRNSTRGLGHAKHDRDPFFSNYTPATDYRIHERTRNRGTTLGSTRANTSTRGHSRDSGRSLRDCRTKFCISHIILSFWVQQARPCPTGVPSVVHGPGK